MPLGIAVDAQNNVFIHTTGAVREVSAKDWTVTTVVGMPIGGRTIPRVFSTTAKPWKAWEE
jgi:hypothetical protein